MGIVYEYDYGLYQVYIATLGSSATVENLEPTCYTCCINYTHKPLTIGESQMQGELLPKSNNQTFVSPS